MIVLSSCADLHDKRHTKYQRKNLRKFDSRKHMGWGGKKKMIAFRKRGSINHPSVPREVKGAMMERFWSKKMGEGKIE
jgi:hypothetical protein